MKQIEVIMVIIGNSQFRGYANHLNNKFEVNGLVKPGTGTDILVNSARNDIMKLTKSGDCFLWWFQ
jgi:hypothetical protein